MARIQLTRHMLHVLLVVLGLTLGAHSHADDVARPTAIRFGVSPWFSTNVQFQQTMIKPIVEALRSTSALAVDYQSAADNVQFVRAAMEWRYDVVFVPVNVAALLAADAGYKPLAGFHLPQSFAVYMLKESAAADTTLEHLQGKKLGMPDEFGLISTHALDVLQQRGMLPGKLIVSYAKYDQLVLQLFRRDVDAIAVNPQVLPFLDANVRNRLVEIYRSPDMDLKLTHVYMVSPRLPDAAVKSVADTFARYYATPGLRQSFAQGGRYLMENLTQSDLEPALRYADGLRLRLKSGVALDR